MLATKKQISIQTTKVIRFLAGIMGLLVLLSLGVMCLRLIGGYPYQMTRQLGLAGQFSLGAEGNTPTFFNTIILFFAGTLLGLIALFKKKGGNAYAVHWGALAFIFLYLSLDEAASFHEMMNGPAEMFVTSEGWLHYAWVAPALIAVFLFAGAYLRFLFHLPMRTRLLFAAAALVYVGGALGCEIAGGYYVSLYGMGTKVGATLVHVEETMEMSGVLIFIYALLSYIQGTLQEVQIRFT